MNFVVPQFYRVLHPKYSQMFHFLSVIMYSAAGHLLSVKANSWTRIFELDM